MEEAVNVGHQDVYDVLNHGSYSGDVVLLLHKGGEYHMTMLNERGLYPILDEFRGLQKTSTCTIMLKGIHLF